MARDGEVGATDKMSVVPVQWRLSRHMSADDNTEQRFHGAREFVLENVLRVLPALSLKRLLPEMSAWIRKEMSISSGACPPRNVVR